MVVPPVLMHFRLHVILSGCVEGHERTQCGVHGHEGPASRRPRQDAVVMHAAGSGNRNENGAMLRRRLPRWGREPASGPGNVGDSGRSTALAFLGTVQILYGPKYEIVEIRSAVHK